MTDREKWVDPIVEEIHRIREKKLREAGGDPKIMVERLMKQQELFKGKLVDLRKQRNK